MGPAIAGVANLLGSALVVDRMALGGATSDGIGHSSLWAELRVRWRLSPNSVPAHARRAFKMALLKPARRSDHLTARR